ncbi:Metallo-beta-lactamase domain-containing protein 2 [Grifola frondosa]|uniref:Metallo-beta-lactamase domain-containing protein 2 n=1 Tax=Grifola frondosa TaxID=5627 RepID=A0A1C7M569_GRIFR|nr:Metallo-beta-lactamase domain-containing protein 2 [Grifola frondosa]
MSCFWWLKADKKSNVPSHIPHHENSIPSPQLRQSDFRYQRMQKLKSRTGHQECGEEHETKCIQGYPPAPTTFLIVETDDIYAEHPFIYAKIVPSANTILLIDTGCGGASNDPDIEITSLREFLETTAVADNGGKPLNEQGRMRYVIVLSHCHYDHILGVEQFTVDSPILASAYSPSFISPINLPAHSLCKGLAVRTPTYTPILVPHQSSILGGGAPLGVTLFHTPGHTPDELALWDEKEKMLYVGDTLYEWEHIIFPNEGNIMTWLSSLDALVALVAQSPSPNEIRINCGHRTALRPALEQKTA